MNVTDPRPSLDVTKWARRHALRSRRGMTIVEFIVVVAVLFVVAAMVLPNFERRRPPAYRIKCVNNLKNVGMAFRIFATDHDDRFPMDVSSTSGGSKEFVDDRNQIWRHFLVLSNELSTPKLVLCPKDAERIEATAFATNRPATGSAQSFVPFASNTNISYFIGVQATETNPDSLLAGDRNLTNDMPFLRYHIPAVRSLGTNHTAQRGVGFDHHIHAHAGNILMGDTSVQQLDTRRLRQALRESGDIHNRIAKP